MGCEADGKYTFVCPGCGESLEVNASMKDVLIERGCVICRSPVTEAAFTESSPTEPT